MPTKTISIELDVYEKLRSLRKEPRESYTKVLRRELCGKKVYTGAEILERIQDGTNPHLNLTEAEYDVMDNLDKQFLPHNFE